MVDDFGFLAENAGGGPGLDVCGDGIPHVLGLEQLHSSFARRVRESVDHIKDCFPKRRRNPRSRSPSTCIADDGRSLGYLDLF